jgi:hypothetical protein
MKKYTKDVMKNPVDKKHRLSPIALAYYKSKK